MDEVEKTNMELENVTLARNHKHTLSILILGAINLAGLVLGVLSALTEPEDERYQGARLIYRS